MQLMKKYPQRHKSHTLEEESIIFFKKHLPKQWNVNSIDRDYGQDLNLEISEDGVYKGLELIVQLKSSENSVGTTDIETQRFKVSTYNYLWNNLRVVLIVKYVKEVDEAYWILLKDVKAPNQESKSFTISLDKKNKVSNIDWNDIVDYVRNISQKKLNRTR